MNNHVPLAELEELTRELTTLAEQHEALVRENATLNHALRTAEEERVTQLAQLAHESKRPLTALRVMLDDVRETCGPSCQKTIDYMEREVMRSARYMDNLITLSQLQIRRVSAPTAVDLSGMAWQVFEYLLQHDTTREKHTDIPQKAQIHCSAEYPQAVLENLIENAKKYTPTDGDIQLQITDEKDHIIICVRNTGHIPASELTSIQRSFRQGSTKTTGSGLGLAIVQESVAALGGTFTLTCEKNQVIARVELPQN